MLDNLKKYHPKHPNYYEGSISDWINASKLNKTLASEINQSRFDKTAHAIKIQPKWIGCENYDDLIELEKTLCYPEALKYINNEVKNSLIQKISKRRLAYSTTGDSIDLNRLNSGNLDFWRVAKKQKVNSPFTCSLVVTKNINASKDSQILFYKGLAIAKLALYIEQNNGRVEISTLNCHTKFFKDSPTSSNDILYKCKIKDVTSTLNLNLLSFALCHPAFNRYYQFSALLNSKFTVDGRLGWVSDSSEFLALQRNTIMLSTDFTSLDQVESWCKEEIDKLEKFLQQDTHS
jgi:hypothetical protein